jgi:predicted ATPase/DNA-binding CsgD family transcriptional regulator
MSEEVAPDDPDVSHPRPATNLPLQLTSFVGRRAEMAELRQLLGRSRLVTIAGASGMGKTRIALEVGAGLLENHPGGVWFVSLASVRDPALVPYVVASELGLPDQYGEPLVETLAERLSGASALLIIDNCEHLLDSSARLAESLLRRCRDLHILATGHEPLRVPGEMVWRIAPMTVPETDGPVPAPDGALTESVRLFEARATLARPRFQLDHRNAATVAQICRRLDGIPLAIELAAARTEMMSVEDILDRLEDRFRLLTGGMRTALPRHQTLRAALDWGHLLLEEPERRLFRRLSVFVGGFDAAAAEAVCSGSGLNAEDVVDHLSRLVDKSFVSPDPPAAGPTRYRILETVRHYAGERLLEAGETDQVRFTHAEHFVGLAEEADKHQADAGQTTWLSRLETEHRNLRAALTWCQAHDAARWLRLATALGWFWVARAHLAEGREWLEGALAMTSVDAATGARGFLWQARLAYWQGDHDAALGMCARSVTLYRELGDDPGSGWPLILMGQVNMRLGRLEEAQLEIEEVLATAGTSEVRVEALMALGELLVEEQRLDEARARLNECLALSDGSGGRWRAATAVLLLGVVHLVEGDLDGARRHSSESLEVFHQLGNKFALATQLDVVAGIAMAESRPERALRLCGAADGLRASTLSTTSPPWEERARMGVIGPARAALGERADAIWEDGQRMALDDAVQYASWTPQTPLEATAPSGPGRLSRREMEVAAMVAQGMTNRRIAEALVLAERTVEGHVERIRRKLGVRSRTQIAVWMVEKH